MEIRPVILRRRRRVVRPDREDLRIIGVEVRVLKGERSRGEVEEFALLPLDVVLPDSARRGKGDLWLDLTVHTSAGDVNLERRRLPSPPRI